MISTRTFRRASLTVALLVSMMSIAEAGPMVASAHPLATDAGIEILRKGGNAVDAAIAVSLMLGVVEPQASGLGGGGLMLYYDAAADDVYGYDFRETAPKNLTLDHLRIDGRLSSRTCSQGGIAVATPGLLAGLLKAHEEHGSLPLADLVAPAVRVARDGHEVNDMFVGFSQDNYDKILNFDETARVYLKDGLFPYDIGDELKQPELAAVLEQIGTMGRDAVYGPEAAEKIAAAVRAAGGVMVAEDLMEYQARPLPLIRSTYRGYEIAAPAGPSGGGVKMLAALELLKPYDMTSIRDNAEEYYTLLTAVLNESLAAADAMVGDPRFGTDATKTILSPVWMDPASERVAAAISAARAANVTTTAPERHLGQTTHLSVIDAAGNSVALTQTINAFFGSGVTVPEMGILLNNENLDFTFEENHPNTMQPGKTPRSNMAPHVIFRDGEIVATLGSPGGSRIPGTLVQVLVNRIDASKSLMDAIAEPRIHVDTNRRVISYEKDIDREVMEAAAAAMTASSGKPWSISERTSNDSYFGGAQGIWVEGDTTEGGADPRRAGVAKAP